MIPALEFMTREEAIETIKRLCAAYDRQALDTIAAETRHEQVERNLRREIERRDQRIAQVESDRDKALAEVSEKDARLSAKDAELSGKDAEIKDLRRKLADAGHTEASL